MTTTHVEHPAHEHTHDPGGDYITAMLDRVASEVAHVQSTLHS